MTPNEIERMINDKIRLHEIRVGIISGIVGGLVTFGIIHAIWILKTQI